MVTFNASGLYSLDNSTMLRIVNQTGATEYLEQVTTFPIHASLFNGIGDYTANFENMQATNSTIITITTEVTVSQEYYPYGYLILLGSTIILLGIALFPFGIHFYLLRGLKVGDDKVKHFSI